MCQIKDTPVSPTTVRIMKGKKSFHVQRTFMTGICCQSVSESEVIICHTGWGHIFGPETCLLIHIGEINQCQIMSEEGSSHSTNLSCTVTQY